MEIQIFRNDENSLYCWKNGTWAFLNSLQNNQNQSVLLYKHLVCLPLDYFLSLIPLIAFRQAKLFSHQYR